MKTRSSFKLCKGFAEGMFRTRSSTSQWSSAAVGGGTAAGAVELVPLRLAPPTGGRQGLATKGSSDLDRREASHHETIINQFICTCEDTYIYVRII